MNRRLLLHKELCEILGCPETGANCRAYYQPPSTIQMKYPAIVYTLDDIDARHANDGTYLAKKRYAATVIDKNPDTELVDAMAAIPLSAFNRSYARDNLNHFVFEIYY